jgi:hypothetical protein
MIHLYHLEKFGLMREAIKAFSAGDPVLVCSGDSHDAGALDAYLATTSINVILLDMHLETDNYQPLTGLL